MKIIAISIDTGKEAVVDDLYFFEEEGIHNFNEDGHYRGYVFKFIPEPGDIIENREES